MKNIKVILLIAMALLLAVPSNAKRNRTTKKQKSEKVQTKLPSSIEYSKGFQMFWSSLLEETSNLTKLDGYRPSNEMFNNNNLFIDENDVYCIRGFLQVKLSEFEAVKFEGLGGMLTYFNDGLYTFTMPVTSVPDMLNVNGIVQIEMAQKVFPRNDLRK